MTDAKREPIVYIDRSDVVEGKLDELKAGIEKLVEFVEANEPQLIAYGFFFDDDGTRMTVVAIHPDSASIEFHMDIGGPEFRKLSDFINLSSIEVYGEPSDKVLDQLRRKMEMLGSGPVIVHKRQAGFAR